LRDKQQQNACAVEGSFVLTRSPAWTYSVQRSESVHRWVLHRTCADLNVAGQSDYKFTAGHHDVGLPTRVQSLRHLPFTKLVGLWALGMLIRCWDAAAMSFEASA
jgi:hypothetical protein